MADMIAKTNRQSPRDVAYSLHAALPVLGFAGRIEPPTATREHYNVVATDTETLISYSASIGHTFRGHGYTIAADSPWTYVTAHDELAAAVDLALKKGA